MRLPQMKFMGFFRKGVIFMSGHIHTKTLSLGVTSKVWSHGFRFSARYGLEYV